MDDHKDPIEDDGERLTAASAADHELLALGLTADPPDASDLAAALPELEGFELIGMGAMGTVWRARQKRLDRVVAVKLLRSDLADDPSFTARFAREARAMARLQHGGIVAVYDYGEVLGHCYLVMEYVDGTDLRAALRAGVSTEEALAMIHQLCDALQYAHEEGVVHRDVKPENILIDRRGRVKVADFGLAKLSDREPGERHSTVARVIGTPHYMAPEQIHTPDEVDHRADIFALGVVVYELLTGKLPLGQFDPPSSIRPLDARLDELVLRSLAQDRERRFQHASEMKERVIAIRPVPESTTNLEPAPRDEPTQLLRSGAAVLGVTAVAAVSSSPWLPFHFGPHEQVVAWLIVPWLVGYLLVAPRVWKQRGSARGALLQARIGVAATLLTVVAAVWLSRHPGPATATFLLVVLAAVIAERSWRLAQSHGIGLAALLGARRVGAPAELADGFARR